MTIGILLGVLIFLIFGGCGYALVSIKHKVVGHVLCTFVTATGFSYDVLLPYEGNEIKPPEGGISALHGRKMKIAPHNLPNTLDKLPMVQYPLAGIPRFLCAEVKRVFYIEGNPDPIPVWQADTLDMARYSKIARSAKTAAGIVQDLTDQPLPTEGLGIKPSYLWIALFVLGAISLAGAILAYMAYTKTWW